MERWRISENDTFDSKVSDIEINKSEKPESLNVRNSESDFGF